MRIFTIFITFFFVANTLYGDVSTRSSNLTTLIDRIKRAKPENKRVLINELKLRLRQENRQTRHNAMMELRRTFNKSHLNQEHFQMRKREHQRSKFKSQNCKRSNPLNERKYKNGGRREQIRDENRRYKEHKKIQNPQHQKEHMKKNGHRETNGRIKNR